MAFELYHRNIYWTVPIKQETRILTRPHFRSLSGGRFLSFVLVCTGLVFGLVATAPTVSAQSATAPDSLAHRLAPVDISADAEKARGVFQRMSDRAKVTYLERETRFLERKLAHLDGVVLRLEARLDSLKSAGAIRERGIATLDSTLSAMRAHRVHLETEARVRELVARGLGRANY